MLSGETKFRLLAAKYIDSEIVLTFKHIKVMKEAYSLSWSQCRSILRDIRYNGLTIGVYINYSKAGLVSTKDINKMTAEISRLCNKPVTDRRLAKIDMLRNILNKEINYVC